MTLSSAFISLLIKVAVFESWLKLEYVENYGALYQKYTFTNHPV